MNESFSRGITWFVCIFISFSCGLACGLFSSPIKDEAESQTPSQVECEQTTAIHKEEETTEATTCEEITESEFTSLGVFEVTAYCSCERCCGKSDGITATGTKAEEGRTIAVDPDKIPYGTVVMINGQEFVAEDCGGAVNGNVVDIYFDSHEEALRYGRQVHEILIRG